ncbi:protein VACUOLELESS GAMETOPHYTES-like [Gastrolobium bilobum]|uniref:protein VACUOLELESS GAMETOPHYTES-like n=1 Tax=Gastrolobium bilobum TaxID=150636 RepID=UPI002AAF43C0|nr:protein VACUOLELESS GAMETOPHYTES-like [Gastrolobium bilobum]
MAPVRKNMIQHFTHPSHPLTYIARNTQFLCDGCKILGNGNRYRCSTCDFDLHEYCGTCPTYLSSFMHPIHQLTLAVRRPQGARHNERVCDVCGTHVNGLFYRCNLCDFDVHPLCTQMPQYTCHPLHPNHVLRLQPQPGTLSSGRCMVCNTTCNFWGYRCVVCEYFGIHLQCVSAPVASGYAHYGSGSSSVSGLGRVLYSAYQNLSSNQGGGFGGNGGATYGDNVADIIAYFATSWLNG